MKQRVDAILLGMSELLGQPEPKFGRLESDVEGIALPSILREKQLLERIDTDLLFRWLPDLNPADEVFNATADAHNRPPLDQHHIINVFFDAIVQQAFSANLC